jgi:hypothetical protein
VRPVSAQPKTLHVLLSVAIGLAGCSSLGFPKRGFVTRYFAGSDLQKSVTTSADFTGQPFHPAIETYAGAARPRGVSGPVSSTLARNLSTCETVARQRATDISFQGFGDATQKTVFDNTYRDCIRWRTNH